jgi:hypothetical protein
MTAAVTLAEVILAGRSTSSRGSLTASTKADALIAVS